MTVGWLLVVSVMAGIAWSQSWRGSLTEDSVVRYDATAGREAWQGVAPATLTQFTFDADDLSVTRFEVRVASDAFDSGNRFRDRNARLVTFESEAFPEIVFTSRRLIAGGEGGLAPGDVREVTVEGALSLHGVERVIEVPLRVSRPEEDRLRVEGGFDVSLEAYGMRAPSILIRTVDDEVRVSLDLTVRLQPR